MLLAQSLCLTAFAEETTLEAAPEAVTETEPEIEPVNEAVIEEPEVEEPEVRADAIQVLIPAGSDADKISSILTKALLEEDADPDTTWEYECIGYSSVLKAQNTAWGSIAGFTSETSKWHITTTYTHAALANNEDGIYDVRVAGTTKT